MSKIDKKDMDGIRPGPIAWMVMHPVAANLLMVICLLGGLFMLSRATKEVFPEFRMDSVSIRMAYPGASPEEVEQGIILAVEDAVRNVEGIGEVTSTANEGAGNVNVEILDATDSMRIAQDIKTAVDRITTFPVDAEDLSVGVGSRRRDVMELGIYGNVEERTLRTAAELLRDRLESNPAIGPVELTGVRDYEIHIEISLEDLRRYRLNLPDVATRIRQTAIELGGGSLKTDGGEILIRMSERRDSAFEFKNVPLITMPSGSQVYLGDVAQINEGFADTNNYAAFNGAPSILMKIYRIGKQTPNSVAKATYEELETIQSMMPDTLKIAVIDDDSKLFRQRAELLMKNGLWGLLLVVCFLALFLDVRLAFWVSMGIPISFMGAFLLFPATDFTINIISMFAFLITLGIVVDDAVISGENIHSWRQRGHAPLKAAIEGAREVAVPITMSVLTNMIAFVPLLFVPGMMGKVFSVIPIVVFGVFILSLVESLFILPAHLSFKKDTEDKKGWRGDLARKKIEFNKGFETFIQKRYKPFLRIATHRRYLTLALFFVALISVGSYALSGRMGMELFPRVESDFAFASVTLRVGAPLTDIRKAERKIISGAQAVIDAHGDETLSTGIYSTVKDNSIEVRAFLTDPKIRPISTKEFTTLWREKTGAIAGAEALSFQSNRGGPGSGAALTVELSHSDTEVLDRAAIALAAVLAEFPNTKDVDDGAARGKRQFDFTMKPLGYTLGLTSENVARQARAAFRGAEAFKQQRGRNEVRILVRLPEDERRSEYTLQNLVLRTPSGGEIMLRDAVEIHEGRAYTAINRRDGRRNLQVSADIDPPSQANQVITAIKKDTLPQLQQRYPGLIYSFEGRQADMRDSMRSLKFGLIAVLFVMYALLALMFSSYSQPFMVLLAIPFGAIGAIIGHYFMDYSLSIMSMFGMLALSGVVINDSLILVEFANRIRAQGTAMSDAVIEAGTKRFRPILLTTMTTFIGLAPMILETSRQARFLIPMALSLASGVLFATFVTLVLIPALYMIIEDIKAFTGRVARRFGLSKKQAEVHLK